MYSHLDRPILLSFSLDLFFLLSSFFFPFFLSSFLPFGSMLSLDYRLSNDQTLTARLSYSILIQVLFFSSSDAPPRSFSLLRSALLVRIFLLASLLVLVLALVLAVVTVAPVVVFVVVMVTVVVVDVQAFDRDASYTRTRGKAAVVRRTTRRRKSILLSKRQVCHWRYVTSPTNQRYCSVVR